jgi:hypothetical protein
MTNQDLLHTASDTLSNAVSIVLPSNNRGLRKCQFCSSDEAVTPRIIGKSCDCGRIFWQGTLTMSKLAESWMLLSIWEYLDRTEQPPSHCVHPKFALSRLFLQLRGSLCQIRYWWRSSKLRPDGGCLPVRREVTAGFHDRTLAENRQKKWQLTLWRSGSGNRCTNEAAGIVSLRLPAGMLWASLDEAGVVLLTTWFEYTISQEFKEGVAPSRRGALEEVT